MKPYRTSDLERAYPLILEGLTAFTKPILSRKDFDDLLSTARTNWKLKLFSLRWFNVDLEEGVLNVFAPKTQKTREVPINLEARRILEAWAHNRKNEFVFYNHDTGKPFVDLKAGFALACKKAGITGVTWHNLRHTFASRLLNRGVDIVTVQQLLGHSTVIVTMRYAHTNLDTKRAAVEKLAGFSDKLVTVCTNVQQSRCRLSRNAM